VRTYASMIALSVALSGCSGMFTDFKDMTPEELAEYDNSWYDDASEQTVLLGSSGKPYMPDWEAEYELSDYEITSTCYDTRLEANTACLDLVDDLVPACIEYTRTPAVADIHYICGDTANELHELSHITHEYDDRGTNY
jgi:hypothetical protein